MEKNSFPLAQSFFPTMLPGRLNKIIVVPPGRQGVVLSASGNVKMLPAGRHRVLNVWERLRGRDIGLQAGYIPAGSFVVRIQTSNLLTRDDDLMDAQLLCQTEVLDSGLFFQQQVLPRSKIKGDVFDLDVDIYDLLAGVVRGTMAEDLMGDAGTEAVLMRVYPQLERLFASQGLHLDYVVLFAFVRAEDRIAAAHKADELVTRLDEDAIRNSLQGVATAAEAKAILDELDLDQVPRASTRLVIESAEGGKPSPALFAAVKSWLAALRGEGLQGRRPRIKALFQRQNASQAAMRSHRRRYSRFWWRGRVFWMLVTVVLTWSLLRLVNFLTGGASFWDRAELYIPILAFGIGLVLDGLKKLYEEWETLQHIHWDEPGTTLVDDLIRKDRSGTDALVRQQCAINLENGQQNLNALRSRLYRHGDEEAALAVRSMEKEIDSMRQTVLDPVQGVPPYIDPELRISRRFWDILIDYDEGLLVRAGAFNQQVQSFVQQVQSSGFDPEALRALQSSLDAFRHHFLNRSQVLKTE